MMIPYCYYWLSRQAGLAILALGCLFFGALPSALAADIDVNANCTLAQAITSANDDSAPGGSQCTAGSGADIINLAADIALSAALPNITSTMTVDGGDHTLSHSANTFRPIQVASNGDLTLRDVTLRGFTQTSGGAVLTNGKLTLQNCVLENNTDTSSTGGGGALRITSSATETNIDRCTFKGNVSENDSGGAIQIDGGDVTISNSAFIQNDSESDSGGAIFVSDGDLIISNSTFIGNTCSGSGCAIFIDSSGNTIELYHSTFWDNATDTSTNISGIQASNGTVVVNNTIIGRSATTGGALCGGNFNAPDTERGIITFNGPQTDGCGTVTVADPKLGAQTGNPPYLPLAADSAAIGVGVDTACAAYPIDVAGNARPDTDCDAGAFEHIPPPPVIAKPDTGGAATSGAATSSGAAMTAGPDAFCTGEQLNKTGMFRVATTYGLCSGVQFNPLDQSALGIGWVVDAGPIAAVDVWGWVTSYVEVCYRGRASTLILDAATSPRAVAQLDSIWDGEWTCAQISSAGTIVFLPADSYLTTPPSDAAAPPQTTALANCMVRLDYALNFRESPGGEIMSTLAQGVTLTAFQRADGWVQVDYHGRRGWVSARYVTFVGSC